MAKTGDGRMTALSFKVFKDKILSGEKTQTIRPIRVKPIKAGDRLSIYWKQRVPKKFECYKCLSVSKGHDGTMCPNCKKYNLIQIDGSEKLFDAVCTDTFLMDFSQITLKSKGYFIMGKDGLKIGNLDKLAKLDGFKNYEEMIKWFSENYDLSKPKNFTVIRWERVGK